MTVDDNESEIFDTRRVSMRIPRWLPIAFFLAAIAIHALVPGARSTGVFLAAGVAAAVGIYLSFRLPPRERTVRIHVNRDGVREGARMLMRRSTVRNATIAEIAGGGAVLTLRSAARSVTFRMASSAEATRVMARLHVLPTSRAMVFARGAPIWIVPLVPGVGMLIFHGALSPLTLVLLLNLVASALALLLTWSRTIAIGREGIRVSSLFSRRFIGYGEIENVTDEPGAIVFRLKGGEIVRVASQGVWTPYTRESGNRHLAHHIRWAQRELLELSRAPRNVASAMIATGGASHVAHYRVAAVPREHLLATAEDPAADVKLRIAAIDALTSDADAEERARLEMIGEASASPELRMAIKRLE